MRNHFSCQRMSLKNALPLGKMELMLSTKHIYVTHIVLSFKILGCGLICK
ncbi:hypothetical protein LINGRAHAP2_LOCUS15489 [Linum grandiflorum]